MPSVDDLKQWILRTYVCFTLYWVHYAVMVRVQFWLCCLFSKLVHHRSTVYSVLNIVVEWTLPPTVTLLENWLLFRSPHYSSNVEVEVHCNHSISGGMIQKRKDANLWCILFCIFTEYTKRNALISRPINYLCFIGKVMNYLIISSLLFYWSSYHWYWW